MIKHLFVGVILSFPISAFGQELPDLPPLKELPSIQPVEPDSVQDTEENKEYIIINRRESINGNYINNQNNIERLEGGDHIKYLDDQNSSNKKACIVINNILDCS